MLAQMDNIQNTKGISEYYVGIYVRLSREDENTKESESILNQKDFLTNYVINKGWILVDIYCDDGYSGTNFERPDFKRMINDIEEGKINLVITKDLSRLGRDYIETGYYLEKYFPSNDIRYIAVNDGVDTMSDSTNNDMNPFRSVINDMYARDISRKVRTAMDTKRKIGKFVGAFAPYGYKKCPDDKNKLIIDEEAAAVVKRIYDLYLDGYGYGKITNILNDDGVLSPIQYKVIKNSNYKNPKSKINLWGPQTVKNILSNPTYCGCLTQNKCVKINYKVNKFKLVPRDEWITVKDTHEPIIDKVAFNMVQKMMASNIVLDYPKHKRTHLLAGLLFCGDCGGRMTYIKTHKGEIYCVCSMYKRFRKIRCTRHSILERELEECVLFDLKNISLYAVNHDILYKVAKEHPNDLKYDDIKSEMLNIKAKLQDIKLIIKSIYEDKLKGILTEQDFINLSKDYNMERERLNIKLTQLQDKLNALNRDKDNNDTLMEIVRNFTSFDNVDNAILSRLIEKIDIFEDQKVVIHYKFKKPF